MLYVAFWSSSEQITGKKHIQQSCSSQKFHGPGASGAHSKLQTWPPSSAGWRGRFYRCWWDQHGKSPSSGWHELRGTWQTHTLLNINSIWNTRSTCSWHSGVGSYNIEHTSWRGVAGLRSSSGHPYSPASERFAWHDAWSRDKCRLCDLQYTTGTDKSALPSGTSHPSDLM